MKNFLLEVGVEEFPAKLLKPVSNHIKTELLKLLDESGIIHGEAEIEYTPRRLFFEIQSVSEGTESKTEELKGPPAKVGMLDGKFTQAALGFAKKNNIPETDLFEKDSYVYGKQFVEGISTKELLESKLAYILSNVPGERFMRSAYGEVKFSRPLQWLAALIYDDKASEIVSFEIEGLKSSNISYGHRFLAPASFEIKNRDQYFKQLEKQGVVLNIEKRKEIIAKETQELAKSINGFAYINPELLDEVANLVESATPVLCDFDSAYLKLPSCVSITVMESHQRYFPVLKTEAKDTSDSELLPYFITVSNNPLEKAQKNIKEGNEKVIVPRFKDAEFFFDEDNKIKLEERLEKLATVNFQSGTMLQKAERIEEIAKYLAYELSTTYDRNPEKLAEEKLDKETREDIALAAKLAKADLSSQMVFEFTELQGEIGGIYAKHQGQSETVSKAISEHYKPRFAGDTAPKTIGGKIISIADKIDSLVLTFALGKIPKGSSDPFALRRQANGLLEILIHCHLIANVDKLVDFAIDTGKSQLAGGKMIKKHKGKGEDKKVIEVPELDWEKARAAVKVFLKERVEFVFETFHKEKEVNKAVLATGNSLAQLNKKHMMIHFVYDLETDKHYPKFAEAANRIMKIGDKELGDIPDPQKFVDDSEKELYAAFKNLEKLRTLEIVNDVPLKRDEILMVTEPVNNFFDKVMVNDKDESIKKNRHALVNYASSLLEEIADFTLIS